MSAVSMRFHLDGVLSQPSRNRTATGAGRWQL